MTQDTLTILFDAVAVSGTGWLATSFAIGLVDLWKRCDPALAAQQPLLPLPSALKPKLKAKQPVSTDVEFEPAEAIAVADQLTS